MADPSERVADCRSSPSPAWISTRAGSALRSSVSLFLVHSCPGPVLPVAGCMRRSVASQLRRVEPHLLTGNWRTSHCRHVAPAGARCNSRGGLLFHSVADSGPVDANRAHKQALTAISKSRHIPSASPFVDSQYDTVIGLEVHCQLLTATKLFSRSSSTFGSSPNSQTSFIDAALPGSLPQPLSAHCLQLAIRTALCLGTAPQTLSRFDRKHYFYADMPQGYQITQQSHPVIRGGRVGDIRVERVQLEQDSGKCLHDLHAHYSHVDLNRAGVALIEVVTAPEMRSGAEAVTFVRRLSALLRHAGVSRAQMEDGSLRCDVNVSVRRRGEAAMGERVEIKNLNSLRSLHRAVQYEADRQVALCESGQRVQRETRTFDSKRGVSVLLRSKEQLLDYRFTAEPDIPWLHIPPSMVDRVGRSMGETQDQQKERLPAQYGLSEYDAQVLVSEQGAVAYFERLVHGEADVAMDGKRQHGGEAASARPQVRSPKLAVNWLTSELFGRIRRRQSDLQLEWRGDEEIEAEDDGDDQYVLGEADGSDAEARRIRSGGRREQLLLSCAVSSAQLGSILDLLQSGSISGKTAKLVLDEMFDAAGSISGQQRPQYESAAEIVQRMGLSTVERSVSQLEDWVTAVLQREADGVQRYVRKANSRFIGFLVGEVLKAAGGRADPKEAAVTVRAALQRLVEEQATEHDSKP